MKDYDYIIVGGGSSGCVAAWRLVEEFGARVLLLEAGARRMSPLMHMPAGYMKYLGRDTYLDMHHMVPQPQLDGRSTIVPQARGLGGGSSVNAMVYMRGQAADYDNWADMLGTGHDWSWADMLEHFKVLENNDHLGAPAHGNAGPLNVSAPFHRCAMTDAFVAAVQNAGEVFTPDFNGGRQRGVGYMQSTIGPDRRRCSASDAFLSRVLDDPRLELRTQTTVDRVLVEAGRAKGVEFRRNGRVERLYAGSGVILASGTYITPKLLMLSGIGDADHLRSLEIAPVCDLPGVGRNLQDHCEVPVIFKSNGRYGYFGEDRGWRMLRNGLQYLLFRSGPVTSIGVEACAFVNPDDAKADATLKIYCVPTVYVDRDISGVEACDGLTMTCCLLRPRSRGKVTLRSNRPDDMPLIDGGFLRDPHDVETIIKGLKTARSFARQQPLTGLLEEEIVPGGTAADDEALRVHAKRMVKTNYHPVGTCRMGPDGDPSAVVDPKSMSVRGLEGLHVIDCSVMPTIVSGNTNAPAMAIAHKAAGLIHAAQR
ncbi:MULTISPECIES: GMC family oxidoreductase [Phyllobacteriaceae]|jgi:choline dehydrogenase|uniref:Sorbosone dehydrogenase n=1 Tax=Mesorhizobium hungaricum TaxID=1566387 RepID=A0A1C2DW46_9HYPH|nr:MULTISPECIES: GMC family oxidoreductase N-terminal domain-containing protein [Mesorhizobium]MBN9233964.1 GMC family oxidoreductase N-terminal domain-containing protein [Mesorhizobium sp.]MDQ0331495.1 choline dehydrogenase [Mesorhizobium sp. YL-MeA3-2017]OCX18866.1 sorbosone dehydrogenase [Mesorhizobium hungaricum]